ncbi:hypothetical protein MPK70_gp275 [Erwinia phage pEa_SNUABM_33]|uniref:Radical SAM core domain-containing protein n=1 Tax=Erwinia phage pEa_SNUABM_33 TaxID=2869556 RepID=A0AAE8C1V2_9CAUD|nr:hypothetical protein MPK70_gp275 [Erwinia phage pEa_SNUABM_33]QZE58151.1 hypothetical protein pEaSNUABM33_00275 [Erwinia phage pEa_SNUABM_33]
MKKIKHAFRLTDLVNIEKVDTVDYSQLHHGKRAIIVGRELDCQMYDLHIEGVGVHHMQYPEECLSLIKRNQGEMLDKWEAGKYGKKKKKEREIPNVLRNFTAILPVTCNADCSFCPEKEMENKAPQKEWQDKLIAAIKTHGHRVDHVSISGGEPTLRMKYLFETIDQIQTKAHMYKVGLTSNGQFLEKPNQLLTFLDLNTNEMLESKLSHLNISMHSFDREKANKIMGVNYTWTLEDLARFRRQLGRKLSFHINFVINEQNIDNIEWEFRQANEFMKENQWIDVVFRVDYNNKKLNKELRKYGLAVQAAREAKRPRDKSIKYLAPKIKEPKLIELFNSIFDGSFYDDLTEETMPGLGDTFTTACPSCFTHRSTDLGNSFAYLKASSYEPNEDEEEYTEMVFHMDGNLYFDWSRKEPVPEMKAKTKKTKRFDFEFEQKGEHDAPNGAALKLEQGKKAKPVRVKKAKKTEPQGYPDSCNYSSPCSYSRGSSCNFGSGMC